MIYLDYNATTPVTPSVLEAMLPWFSETFFNAASAHQGGRRASHAVDVARDQISSLLHCRAGELVFTSGATEANNLALKGLRSGASRMVTVATEHKAVLDVATYWSERGRPVTILSVSRDGLIDLDELAEVIAVGDVGVVSVMLANNETGVIQDLARISEIIHQSDALLHCDATQAVGKMKVDVDELGVDLLSLSAHKLYGPKGVGALFVRRGVELGTQMHGGGHENGMRSGTLNVPGIVGFGAAAEYVGAHLENSMKLTDLLDEFTSHLAACGVDFDVVAAGTPKLPNTINIRFIGADGEAVMVNAPKVAMSSGSACTARIPEPSHVLTAMGLSHAEAEECLRISCGIPTTVVEMREAAALVAQAVTRVKELTS